VKPSWRRLTGLLLVMSALILAAAGCGGGTDEAASTATEAAATTAAADTSGSGSTSPAVVIGTKNFTEEFILGQLYKQALEAKGYTVTLKDNIGSTEIIDKALTSGKINFYPEYTGTALTVVFGATGSEPSAQATYDAAKAKYEGRGQTLLAMTPFSDSDALAVRQEDAQGNELATIADLANFKGGSFTLGGQPEFKTRAQGLPGLETNYGLSPTFVPFAGISPYEALDQKKVDVAAIFSTDPPLASGKYMVLEDTKAQFGFQNVAPVVDQDVVDALGQDFVDAVDAVSGKLTAGAIIAMNSAVAIDQKQPADIARQFLQENGLL
jgi:osmoprotectant transport system substrate-binding protein